MNPNHVAQARTARLAREASKPVYTTSTKPTPAREHLSAVEMEDDYGRGWSTMKDSEVSAYIDKREAVGYWVSDIDHAAKCWCFQK